MGAKFLGHAVDRHIDMGFSHPLQHRLFGRCNVLETHRRVFLGNTGQRRPHLAAVASNT
jgi:hypothetical protein